MIWRFSAEIYDASLSVGQKPGPVPGEAAMPLANSRHLFSLNLGLASSTSLQSNAHLSTSSSPPRTTEIQRQIAGCQETLTRLLGTVASLYR